MFKNNVVKASSNGVRPISNPKQSHSYTNCPHDVGILGELPPQKIATPTKVQLVPEVMDFGSFDTSRGAHTSMRAFPKKIK